MAMMAMPYAVAFWWALLFTELIEIPVVWYLLTRSFMRRGYRRSNLAILTVALFANAATLPCLWFVFPTFLGYMEAVAVGEFTAFAAEAALFALLLRAYWKEAAIASLAANIWSVLLGLLIMPP